MLEIKFLFEKLYRFVYLKKKLYKKSSKKRVNFSNRNKIDFRAIMSLGNYQPIFLELNVEYSLSKKLLKSP